MPINEVITRFAPSPTGYLHIGGARTALFNWLWARHNKGKFILRIEDTDQKRNVTTATQQIIEDMKWLGLDWDNELCFQSQRTDIYNKYIDVLLNNDTAYTDNESKAVYYRTPKEGITTVKDTIRGEVKFNNQLIKDHVIRKSDGLPTYNFACVVDDYLMGVTHVIRAQEHLNNTPIQQLIWSSLGYGELPEYTHVSIILNTDGKKLSKRDATATEITVKDFRQSGYLPAALINFIVLIGWNPGGNKEIMTLPELVGLFSLKRLVKSNGKFDRQKLLSFNKKHKRLLNG